MDPDVRPQDDLFGHVNGRWLDETEIPSDRSSWGPFVQLADAAEEQVHAIIEDLAAKVATDATGDRSTPTPRRSATSSRRSWTPTRSTGSAPRPVRAADRRGGRAARRPRPGGVPRRVRADRRPRAVRLLRQHRRPQLRPLPLQPGAGRPRAARRVVLPRRQVRRDPREVRRLPDPAASSSAEQPTTPRPAPRDRARHRHPAGRRPLGARRDPRRPEDLQPDDRRRAAASSARPSTGTPTSPTSARRRTRPTPAPRSCVRQPSYFEHLSTVLDEVADRGLARLAAHPGAALRGAVPHRRLRRGQLRLLRPHPQRHPRAAGPLEARRSRWSRARSARRSARSTSRGTSRRAPRR